MLVAARVYERIPAYNCTDGTEPSAATLPLLVHAFGPQTIRRSRRLKRVRAASPWRQSTGTMSLT